jgi:hypothetical protein
MNHLEMKLNRKMNSVLKQILHICGNNVSSIIIINVF